MAADDPLPSTATQDSTKELPRPFGRYRLLERLGAGGMGTVYRALDQVLDVEVALKVPHADLLSHPPSRERFFHEARAAARLDHPSFAHVRDVGVCEGTPYLAMRYVPGVPLPQRLPADARAAVALVHALAVALAEAHRRGVVHRDLKPSNVLVLADGTPVLTDFGLAVRLDAGDPRLSEPGAFIGTAYYAAPEQVDPGLAPIGPACDVYGLGGILYKLLTGEVPFRGPGTAVFVQILRDKPDLPSRRKTGLDPALDAICLRALAKLPEERFAGMHEFAAALADWLDGAPPTVAPPPTVVPRGAWPRIARGCLRFAFLGYGESVAGTPRDRLFLDVGNDLRPGVIDHHFTECVAHSTTALVLRRPDLVRAALERNRDPNDAFTIVLHERPDLDAVAAAWLAAAYLETGAYPPSAEALAHYVDKVDEGSLGMSLSNPFSLYAAYLQLVNRLLRASWHSPHECWRECVQRGLELVGYAVATAARDAIPLPDVDAIAGTRALGPEDRQEIVADADRYQAKLREPHSHARRARLLLPGQFGGTVVVESLRVRDVQNGFDPERCVYFKDWARTDASHAGNGRGFDALCVYLSEGPGQTRRSLLSVTPASCATLRGLGELLDQAEADRRRAAYGMDDRVIDPATGVPKPPRPGYANADPWYDGRAHGWTIVDAPRAGTLLTADEIEAVFLKFGGAGLA